MNRCTEKTGLWPAAPEDVSPDELDAFLDHAEQCRFHAEKLRLEEEELGSLFRLARGLDSHGRILRGQELKEAINEHKRRHVLWNADAQRMRPPLKRIYVSNRGSDLSGGGEFSYFDGHGEYPGLDAQAGLQIWGVVGDGKSEEVLLGYYPLAGVKHTGKELFFPLDNGYTIGLGVEQRGESHFIRFRCVENDVLARELDDIASRKHKTPKVKAARAAGTGDFARKRLSRVSRGVSSLLSSPEQKAFAIAACVAIVIMAGLWGESTATPDLTDGASVAVNDQSASTTEEVALANAFEAVEKVRQTGANKIQRGDQNATRRTKPAALALAAPYKTRSLENSHAVSPKARTAWYFQTFGSGTRTNKSAVVHTGMDALLRDELFAEINQREIQVVRLDHRVSSFSGLQQVFITWGITRQNKSVTVEAILTRNGESRFLSFRSDGSCPEQLCEAVVRDAVSGVFAVMNQTIGTAQPVDLEQSKARDLSTELDSSISGEASQALK